MKKAHIIIDKNIRHGKPVIQGTRIAVEEVLGALAGGMTYREIEREYGVGNEGIRAAIGYAAGWFRGEEVMVSERIRA
ncbi:MAG: DUF433 domain-containing protein [Candidatus Sungiibacteriota bacterium]